MPLLVIPASKSAVIAASSIRAVKSTNSSLELISSMPQLQDIAKDMFSLSRLQDNGVPTASIAVLNDGKIDTHVLTSGREDNETVYQAASISKAICALAVAKLVDDGKLSYETKVVDHLDAELVDVIVGKDQRMRELMQHVTIKMLLSHTSGLSQHGFPGYGSDAIPSPQDTIAGKFPANTPRIRFDSFPGSQCSYSGGGFTVLQLMLEKITRMPFAELMQQTLLRPLGMIRSWYGDLTPGETNFAKAYLTAQTPAEVARGYNILPELAAAGLWTTPSDLLRAVSAIQESLYTNSGFLKQETARNMLTRVASGDSLGVVGLGWWINDVGYGHGGDNYPGYNAYLMGFHAGAGDGSPRTGVAIMVNSELGHPTCVKQILAAIMYAEGWGGSTVKEDLWLPHARDGFVPYPAPASAVVEEGWQAWRGKWDGDWEIVEKGNGSPALKFRDFAPMLLRPAAAPAKQFFEGRKEIWLVADGLNIGVRLTWEDGGKGEEVVRLQMEDGHVLKRLS